MRNFFKKLLSPFSKMKSLLGQKLRLLFSRTPDNAAFDELEQMFYEADLGPQIAGKLVDHLRLLSCKHPNPDAYLALIKEELLAVFTSIKQEQKLPMHTPHVILVVGVNGSGKTTTLAKLARFYQAEGKKVLIAAGDTFRAAAVEQLEAWGARLNIPIVKSQPNGDPSAVAFDALASAKAQGLDIVLIDTAGRLQNKTDLMQELAKVRRVCQKQIERAPHETLLVLDATVGQNSLDQARTFHQFTPITGIVLSKLDGSAKGGIAVPICQELKIPIQWVGLGEDAEDLIPFDPESYLNALLGMTK